MIYRNKIWIQELIAYVKNIFFSKIRFELFTNIEDQKNDFR